MFSFALFSTNKQANKKVERKKPNDYPIAEFG